MQYYSVPDKAVGDTFQEVMWDQYIKDNINRLITGPQCQIARGSNQSITNTTDTLISYTTEEIDSDGMFDIGAPTIITIQTAGVYICWANATWADAAGSHRIESGIRVNGTMFSRGSFNTGGSGGAPGGKNTFCVALLYLSVGQTVDHLVFQNSGGAHIVSNSRLAVARI